MADEVLQFDMASVVEDVLQQHGKRLSDIDLASRKAEEASVRRYEATGWLRKMVGVVAGKDFPAQPSEEEFRLSLRSGIILCNVLNKVQPGAVPKVVEPPSDIVIISDGAALSAYQYFENIRNFLDSIEEMGIPAFEASDLEQGGKSSRIVNCILALKSYNDWKQGGGKGVWKFSGNLKPSSSIGKQFVRKSSDLFMNSLSRNSSTREKSLDSLSTEQNSFTDLGQDLGDKGIVPHSLHMLVRELLSDKNQEDIPVIVENMLSKVMEEFEHRLASQNEQAKTTLGDISVQGSDKFEETETSNIKNDKSSFENDFDNDESKKHAFKHQDSIEHKQRQIHEEHQNLDEHEQKRIHEEHQNLNEHEQKRIHEEHQNLNEHEQKRIHEEHQNMIKGQQRRIEEHQNMVKCQQKRIQELKSTLHSTKEDMQMLSMKYQEEVSNLGKHVSSLARAACGYQKVLEENRKLYNQVQDLKGNIRVYCRVRPFLPGQPTGLSIAECIDEGTLAVTIPAKNGKGKKLFTFNKVFGPSASQEQVFSDTQPLIRSVLDGYNVCIFAYGQTGSGKTYTMTGPRELTKESLGVNYRAFSDLFLISEQRKDSISYDVSVQMIEIYNEQVRDLLATDDPNKSLDICNNSQNGINLPNANLVPVTSTSDVINLMNLGHKNRALGSTAMNDRSSRSHSCLTVHVQGRYLTSGSIIGGCMHLVDLAGSERIDKTEANGDRLKEAQHINKSLSALGDVISSLAQKDSHISYRNSKLTQLLQDALGCQAKILMFVHVSPEPDALGETISTLKFAERVSIVELGTGRGNKDSVDVKDLKEQIANLKAALSRKDTVESSVEQSRSISPDRVIVGSYGSSPPSGASWQSSIVDISKAERRSSSSSASRMLSSDAPTEFMDSPPWPMLEKWDEDGRQSPDMFYHTSKVYPEQSLNKISALRRRSLDNDSDDLEAETSDCSELDYQCQLNVTRSNNMPVPVPNGVVGSKLKRPTPKQTAAAAHKTPELRSQIPQPTTRKSVSNGTGHSPLHKHAKQQASTDGRRRPAAGK